MQFSLSVVSDSLRPHRLKAHQATLSITNSWSLLKLMSIELVMPCNHLTLCCPLLLQPSIFPRIRVFSNESVFTWGGNSIGVSTSASVLPKNIQDWFPDFPRIDWLELFAVQGTLKTLPQHHNSKASILWLIYSSALTYIHDYWKNQSFD